ncbi:hypothetical protein BT63DRAFT_424057 [Microthyrium microscopicum]|uniref:Uncharacterized protein n=1 Tax=Microthyrium microscopicum TaxID=703497 RepID=A0A6A6UGT5_9PEZI|nr:hypothetical protein BT63DRAFT_424057 [Microthyrium microscopicum]
MLKEIQTSGKLTKHIATTNNGMLLAVNYKLEGSKITLSDALSIMSQDNREVQYVVQYYESCVKSGSASLDGDAIRYVKEKLLTVLSNLQQAAGMRERIREDRTAPDDPIVSVMHSTSGTILTTVDWNDYDLRLSAPASLQIQGGASVHFEGKRGTVESTIWLSSTVVEIRLVGDTTTYFANPLEEVEEAVREDQVRMQDIALLAGHYIIIATAAEGGGRDQFLVENCLKIANTNAAVQERRGRKRKTGAISVARVTLL